MFSVLRINGGIAAKFWLFAVICCASVLFAASPSAALTQDSDGFYLLASASDLEAFRDMVNGGGVEINARLTADIDLSRNGEPSEWLPIGNPAFCGVFDGGGHTVSGYVVRAAAAGSGALSSTYYSGFFANIGASGIYGTVKNLILNGSVAPVGDKPLRAGGVAGYLYGDGSGRSTILNCTQIGDVRIESASEKAYAGGIVGYNGNGIISNCFYSGSVYAATGAKEKYAGGIAGYYPTGTLVYIINCCWHNNSPAEEEGSGYAQHGIGNKNELKVPELKGDFRTQPVVTSLAAVADKTGISIGADNTATVTLVTKPGSTQDMSGYITNASVVEGSYDEEVVDVAHNGGLTFTVRALAAGETPVTFSASLYSTDFDASTLAPSDAPQEMTATVHIKVNKASSVDGAADSSGGGGGGGCSSGFGWPLLAAAAFLFIVKKR